MQRYLLAMLLVANCFTLPVTAADPPADEVSPPTAPAAKQPTQEALFQKFEDTLSGATLKGKFTIVGKPEKGLLEETYEIKSVQKLEQGDFWLFKARVKYGEHDLVVPMPLEVKWAGDTPVITLSETTIPGLGTFSARVVIHDDWYAGTWIHGKAGGHLFGTISRNDAAEQPNENEPPSN